MPKVEVNKQKIKELFTKKQELEKKLYFAEMDFNKIDWKYSKFNKELKTLQANLLKSTPEALGNLQEQIEDGKKEYQQNLKSSEILNQQSAKATDEYNKAKTSNDKRKYDHLIQKLKKQNRILLTKNRKLDKDLLKMNNDYRYLFKFKKESAHKKIKKIEPIVFATKKIYDEKYAIVKDLRNQRKNIHEEYIANIPNYNEQIALSVKNLNVWYGKKQALVETTMDFPKNQVTAIIGPSGCGKSTFLQTLNRINDEIPIFHAEGTILLESELDILKLKSIYNSNNKITLPQLRTKVGMVFQHPNPFPTSIYKNVIYGPKINGEKNKFVLENIAIKSLKEAAIFEEVKDNLKALATGLSGGQQQRICIARALANRPEILLMDEPTSALDPIAASKVEDLIVELKKHYTIIMVTHSMQQAARLSDKTAFFYQGRLIEYGDTQQIFENPRKKRTEDYIRGRFG